MAKIKFEVLGSYTDRVYFSRIYELESTQFSSHEELMDQLDEITSEDEADFDPSAWNEEGSEDIGGGFTIDEIKQL
jgi:hypothetical protein